MTGLGRALTPALSRERERESMPCSLSRVRERAGVRARR